MSLWASIHNKETSSLRVHER